MAFIIVSSILLLCFTGMAYGNIGTASPYDPPYTPTRCNGNQADQFPAGNFFASVREELWDGGAACGRRYKVTCLSGMNSRSSSRPNICTHKIIDVVVVDFCPSRNGNPCPSTFLLSNDAFSAISRSQSGKINVQFYPI